MRFLVDYGLAQFKTAQMRWTVNIQQNQPSGKNQYGEQIDSWVTLVQRKAFLKPLTGREYFNAEMVGGQADYLMICRYYNLTPDMRITTNCTGGGLNRWFNIVVSLNPGEFAMCTLMIVYMKEHRPSLAES